LTTGPNGPFYAPFLVPGLYTVRVELAGFKTFEQTSVTVSLGQTTEVDVRMEVGAVAETVSVTASTVVIDTTSTTAGAVLPGDLLARVPVGRRVTDALSLAPGVSSAGGVGRENPSFAGGHGSRQRVPLRWRQHQQRRLRRNWRVLGRVRFAWDGNAVRFRRGDPGEDRRL
jgi:outer membrane receptor protein involved in Fe transport